MKKLIYLIVTIISAILFSAFTFSNVSKVEGSIKKANYTDTTILNVSVNTPSSKVDKDLLTHYYTVGVEAYEADIKAKEAYLIELSEINNQKDTFTTTSHRLREIIKCTGKNQDKLYKETRSDLSCKFWSYLIILLLFIWFISDIFNIHKVQLVDWRYQTIRFVLILIGIVLLNQELYYILSYIFNHGYLITQEIIKLI